MSRSLQIVVAVSDLDMGRFYTRVIPWTGHDLLFLATTGKELVEKCATCEPDLIVLETDLPGSNYLTLMESISADRPLPIVLVSADCDPSLIERAAAAQVVGYLVKPITQADLELAIALAIRRFRQFQALADEVAELRGTFIREDPESE